MAKRIRMEARDVDTAITKGINELRLRRDQVEVTVVQRPSKGFLGIGSKPAIVEIKQKRWDNRDTDAQIYMDYPKKKTRSSRGGKNGREDRGDKAEPAEKSERPERTERSERPERGDRGARNGRSSRSDRPSRDGRGGGRGGRKGFRKGGRQEREPREPLMTSFTEPEAQALPAEHIANAQAPEKMQSPMHDAKEMLENMLRYMGVKADNVNVWWDGRQGRILLTFDCDNPALVIGKDGVTLEAMQYLITLSMSRSYDTNISVTVETQNYWTKIEKKLDAEVERALSNIKRGLKTYRLRPMPSQMRRYIHKVLAESEEVSTVSEGEGKWRKVVVVARDLAQKAQSAVIDAAADVTVAAENISKEVAEKAEELKEAFAEKKEEWAEVAAGIKEDAAEKAEEVKEAAYETAQNIKETMTEKTAEAAEILAEKTEEYKNRAIEKTAEFKEEFLKKADEIKDMAREDAAAAIEKMKEALKKAEAMLENAESTLKDADEKINAFTSGEAERIISEAEQDLQSKEDK